MHVNPIGAKVKAMDEELRKELRTHAWAYFDRHAEQRLKTFNFYLILCGAIVAGVLGLRVPTRSYPMPGHLPFCSATFRSSFGSWMSETVI